MNQPLFTKNSQRYFYTEVCLFAFNIFSIKNSGVSNARNYGIKNAKYNWIALLDADDLWEPDRLAAQIQAMKSKPEVELFFTQMQEFEDFEDGTKVQFKAREEVIDGFSKCTLLCRKALFDEFGGFDESLRVGEFIAWFQKVREAKRPNFLVPEVLVRRRIHGANTTAKVDRNEFLQLLRKQLAQKRKELNEEDTKFPHIQEVIDIHWND